VKSKNLYFLLLCILSATFLFPGQQVCPVFFDESQKDRIFVKADQFLFDKVHNTYKAFGHVHLIQHKKNKRKELFCDEITYDKERDRVIAVGHVFFKDEDNNIAYSDYVELVDELKNGFIKSAHIITKKEERILASHGVRTEDNFAHLYSASYTPCKVCGKEDATWQFNAKEAVHDEQAHLMRFYNVTFSLWGVPIFYSPYFSHPDPTVKREPGLLMPAFELNEVNGFTVIPTVYLPLDKYSDLTMSPILMKNKNPIITSIYRRNIYNGTLDADFSLQSNHFGFEEIDDPRQIATKDNKLNKRKVYFTSTARSIPQNNWHIFFNFSKDIDEHQKLYVTVNRTSDANYLERYPRLIRSTSNPDALTLASKVVYEYFKTNSYFSLQGRIYQQEVKKLTPLVLPIFFYQHFTKESVAEGFSTLTFYTDHIDRVYGKPGVFGKKTSRFYANYQWGREIVLSNYLLSMSFDMFSRGYLVKGYNPTSIAHIGDIKNYQVDNKRSKLFLLPSSKISLSYPLVYYGKNIGYMLEPKAAVVASPYLKSDMPNNDSRTFSLDDSSIFLSNRFDGYDRFDSGIRFIYGIFQKLYFSSTKYISWFVGHSKRLDNKQILPNVSFGENKRYSDIVNHVKLVPSEYFKIRYRNAIDYKSKQERFREVGFIAGQPLLSLNMGYMYVRHQTLTDTKLSQINWIATSKIDMNWSLSYGEIRDLSGVKKGVLKKLSALKWENDCLNVQLTMFSTNLNVVNVPRNKGFSLTVELKFLGPYTFLPSEQAYTDTGLSHF
jgi:LPS-assembly protein